MRRLTIVRTVCCQTASAVAIALAAAAAYWAYLTAVIPDPDRLGMVAWYFVPIGVPFVLFLLDRWHPDAAPTPAGLGLDAAVVGLSLTRAFVCVLPASGHAWFLTHALLAGRSAVARAAAALVLAQVYYAKIVVLGDKRGLAAGLLFGLLSAELHRRLTTRRAGCATAEPKLL